MSASRVSRTEISQPSETSTAVVERERDLELLPSSLKRRYKIPVYVYGVFFANSTIFSVSPPILENQASLKNSLGRETVRPFHSKKWTWLLDFISSLSLFRIKLLYATEKAWRRICSK